MRNMLFAVALALCFSHSVWADPVSPPPVVPPGVDLCGQFNVCGTPTIIEVELGGKGTDIWTDVIALHEVDFPNWFYFVDGTSLPPGSIWMTFLLPMQMGVVPQIGLSSPLTWRADPSDSPSAAVPEPSSLALLYLGLGVLSVAIRWKKYP
jgi:hypothetical protein